MSDEVLLYHMLLTLQPKYGSQWELVVDFSHSSRENRFKVSISSGLFLSVTLKCLELFLRKKGDNLTFFVCVRYHKS